MASLINRKNMWMWMVATVVLVIVLVYLARRSSRDLEFPPPQFTEQPYVMPVSRAPAVTNDDSDSSDDDTSDDDTSDDDTDSEDEMVPPTGAPLGPRVTQAPGGMPMMWPVSA
jgi:hypothetical protein